MHQTHFLPVEGKHTAYGWNITPNGLRDLLVRLNQDFPALPIVITENGAAFDDAVVTDSEGKRAIHDVDRIDYLRAHIRAVSEAMNLGVDVRGYFVWTFLDDFEWERGYSMTFGLVHIDRDTLQRTPKDSAWWYRDIIRANQAK